MDAPGEHISVGYRVADTFVLEEDPLRVREPYSPVPTKKYTERMSLASTRPLGE